MIFQDISTINWDLLNSATTEDYKQCYDFLGIPKTATWVLPQLMAFISANFKLQRSPQSAHRFSFKESIAQLGQLAASDQITFTNGKICPKSHFLGILRFLKHSPRGDIYPKGLGNTQTKLTRYCAAVPLVLSALKEYRNIGYNEWDWSEESAYIEWFTSEDFIKLLPLIREKFVAPWSAEELIAITNAANIAGEGSTAPGSQKSSNPQNQHSIKKVAGYDSFNELSQFNVSWLKPLFCQTWIFQPHIVNKYMITRFDDLDLPAESIRGDLDIIPAPKKLPSGSYSDAPWMP